MWAMLLASILFGIMAFMAKVLSFYLPAEEIVFIRFLIGLIGLILILLVGKIKLDLKNKPLLIFRGLVGGAAITCYFKAISMIPLSDAVLLSFTYPIFATLFASLWLKEELKLGAFFALLTAFVGIYLIIQPEFTNLNFGYNYALFSAILAGMAVVSIRELRKYDDSWGITLSLMIGGTIFGSLFSINKIIIPSANLLMLGIAMAIIATIAQLLLTHAYKYCNVVEGGTISMFTIVVSVALAILFLGETLSTTFILGAILIVGSIVYLLHSHPGEIIK